MAWTCNHFHIFYALVVVSLPALFLRSPSSSHVHTSRPYYQFSTSENCGDVCAEESESDNTYIVRLSKPWHHFDSNHWFHVSEYYLSRHQSAPLAQVPSDANVIILSDDPGFASNVTEMTLFIMMLSFTQGNPKNVFVVDYAPLMPVKTAMRDKKMHIFEYSGPYYHYKRDLPYFERYKLVPPSDAPLAEVVPRKETKGERDKVEPSSFNFTTKVTAPGLSRCTCGHFVTEVGAAPIDRGYWFGGVEDVQRQRDKISSLCPSEEVLYHESAHESHELSIIWALPDNTSASGGGKSDVGHDQIVVKQIQRKDRRSKSKKSGKSFRNILLRGPEGGYNHSASRQRNRTASGRNSTAGRTFKMVVYQRNEDRKILYLEHAMKTLKSNLPHWTIEVMFHQENLEPCMLKASLEDADIFLTTHGFQSMAILFMKKGSLIMELFPYKYWKVGYKPLAEEFGVHHRWMQSQGPVSASHYLLYLFTQHRCMLRDFSRKENIIMTPHMLKTFLELAKDIEFNRIGAHNAPAIFGVKDYLQS